MKYKIIIAFIFLAGINTQAFSQDTTHTKSMQKTNVIKHHKKRMHATAAKVKPHKKPLYNDNELGGSSPLYNTYKKNKYGAGAVTTSPK